MRLFQLGCLAVLVVAGVLGWLGYTALRPGPGGEAVVFQVRSGMSGAEVARRLESNGLIRSTLAFRMLERHLPTAGQLRPGYYKLEPEWNMVKLYQHLMNDPPLARKATFPEGLTTPEVAAILQKQGILKDTAEFVTQASREGQSFGPIFPRDLEGYLYPDTYDFPWDANEKQVISRMTGQFEDVVQPLWEKHKAHSPLRSLGQVVVLASLIEREAQLDSERGLIAGVYINRMHDGMPLQCDATIQYALGKPKVGLTLADLQIESPYNTYKHPGLPPGPIANPGQRSLQAAMSPTPSHYLYYVRNDLKNDGSHVFTQTYAEHQEACRKYQK